MPSDVQIANLALAQLGEPRITSLEDDTARARTINAIYALKRQALLRAHPWKFATARAALGLLGETPVFGWAHAYQLPTDCLRARALNPDDRDDRGDAFDVEGRTLVTDEGTANLVYTKDVTDPQQFDALFVDTFAALLEAELAISIANSTTKQQAALKKFEAKLSEARSLSAQEGTPPQAAQDEWERSRA